MTTHVLDRDSVATQFHRRTASRSLFFAAMSGMSLFIVLSGFTPTLYLRPLFQPAGHTWISLPARRHHPHFMVHLVVRADTADPIRADSATPAPRRRRCGSGRRGARSPGYWPLQE